jgi:ribonuclease III
MVAMMGGKIDRSVALESIQEASGYRFRQAALLDQALTHPSWLAENEGNGPDNQRLEFLGDAVLQLAATAVLFEALPGEDEGQLTKIRSALTREQALADYALVLGLGGGLRLGRGEARQGGAGRASTLADAFEAVLGAIFVEAGFTAAVGLIGRLITPALADVAGLLAAENPKGALQEHTQERYHGIPCYETVSVSGPDHEPRFEVAVVFQGAELARAVAGSRRAAECHAAEDALRVLLARQGARGTPA